MRALPFILSKQGYITNLMILQSLILLKLTPKAATASCKFVQHVPKEIPAQGVELLTGSEPILWMKLGQAANLRNFF